MTISIRAAVLAVMMGGWLLAPAAWSDTGDTAQLEEGKAIFQKKATPTCATCHALNDAGAAGSIGPDLDEFKPDRDQIAAALRDGVGVMPSFAETLDEDQTKAVIEYVYTASHQ